MPGKMDCFGLSDTGQVREMNEDQFLIADLSKSMQVHHTSLGIDDQTRLFGTSQGKLLLVADGMGGHAAGRRASTLAVDSLTTYVLNMMPWFFRLRGDCADYFEGDLRAALGHCQGALRAESDRVPSERGMGTTLTMAYVCWPLLFVVHVGDSRCYLLRGSRLRLITHDHTVARKLVDEGVISEADAETSRWSHVLWNVVGGGSDELKPEVHKAELQIDDQLLLCTDGLTRHVTDKEITKVLQEESAAEAACGRLVAAANAGGGRDNITVVVASFREAQQDLLASAESRSADNALDAPPSAVVAVSAG